MNWLWNHPCIIYQNNNTKEMEFAKLMNLINKQIYGSNDIITYNIGIFCVHRYYSNEIANYSRDNCDSDNDWGRQQFIGHYKRNKEKLIEYFQTIKPKNFSTYETSSPPIYLQKYLEHLKNISMNDSNKIQNVSQYAETYLKHFKLELIDFCISKAHAKLIERYETILFRISYGFWNWAYAIWHVGLRYIVVGGDTDENKNKEFISLLPYTI